MKKKEKVARPGGLELPTFWFVAIRVKMLNALFGVAYGLETPFFPQLAAPNVAPKTELCRTCPDRSESPFFDSLSYGMADESSARAARSRSHPRGTRPSLQMDVMRLLV
jgi:hypothetical protein